MLAQRGVRGERAEDGLHIHLPRPLHGWRELLGEIGTIVIGILIALALEQALEWLHERHASGDARENIRGEIATNLGLMASRAATAPCIEQRLNAIAGLIAGGDRGVPAPLWIGRPQVWELQQTRWQASTQTGRSILLSTDEQAGFSEIYGDFQTFVDTEAREQAAWAKLRALEDLRRLDPVSAWNLREALQEARYANWRVRVSIAQSKESSAKMGIVPERNPWRGSRSVCLKLAISRAEAIRQLESGTGYSEP